MPKVSIIVPVYNVEEYLEKCLQSLVSQTLDDLEIIIVNDGSTDRSQIIIDQFQSLYPLKIKTFNKINGGLSDARNFGLDHATGNFVGFVDSDDYVLPEMFADMNSLAEKHSAEMVICNLEKADQNGKILQKITQLQDYPEKIILVENFMAFGDLSYFACNKLFKRDLFLNKRFQKNMHFEDIELIPQLLLKCKTIAHTEIYHYQYLERENSISKTHTDKGSDIFKAVANVRREFEGSVFSVNEDEFKNFAIFQGVYSFLAYFAFVKDEKSADQLFKEYEFFRGFNSLSLWKILTYRRFGKNYLLSLPRKKIIYYLFCFVGFQKLIRKLV